MRRCPGLVAGVVGAGLLAVVAIVAAGPAAAFQQQELETVFGEHGYVWQPAPTPPGATSWAALQDLELTERIDGDWIVYDAAFGDGVKALEGETIKINGFMMPLQNTERQTHFVLMAYPPSCPFHLAGGPSAFIEIKAAEGVPFSYDPILMEGTFQLEPNTDTGVLYRMVDARPVGAD